MLDGVLVRPLGTIERLRSCGPAAGSWAVLPYFLRACITDDEVLVAKKTPARLWRSMRASVRAPAIDASDARVLRWLAAYKGQQHPLVVRRHIDGHDSRRDFFGSAG